MGTLYCTSQGTKAEHSSKAEGIWWKQGEPWGALGSSREPWGAEQDSGARQTWAPHLVILNWDASDILLSANPAPSSGPQAALWLQ